MTAAFLTVLALIAFAGNSLLCRAALATHSIGPASFIAVRLGTGAIALAIFAWRSPAASWRAGSWASALSLILYGFPFSFAYVGLPAGLGALILFGSVQMTMIGWELRAGIRPPPAEWIGGGIALCGLVGLTLPGATAPPLWSSLLMAVAGMCWGIYSLRGRLTDSPIAANAGNFLRCAPIAAAIALPFAPREPMAPHGLLLAAASGVLTTGVGYAIWYAALRSLTGTRAAIVQLAVPVIAAVGGIVLLGEAPTVRLVAAGSAIVGGVLFAVIGRQMK